MKITETTNGDRGTSFTYDRKIRWHSPRYIVNLVKYARERFGVDFIGFLDENLMTMHQFSGKKWLTDIADLWISDGLQPQCVRDGVDHDPDRCHGVHWGGTSHATLVSQHVLKVIKQAGCTHLVYGYEVLLAAGAQDGGQGGDARDQTSGRCAGRSRRGSGRSRTR